jgi:hypothetical protein
MPLEGMYVASTCSLDHRYLRAAEVISPWPSFVPEVKPRMVWFSDLLAPVFTQQEQEQQQGS